VQKRLRAERTGLVGVHNLRFAVASERLLEHLDCMTSLQRESDLLGQYLATGRVHNGCEVDEPFCHRDVGHIPCLHLVRPVDGESAKQVWQSSSMPIRAISVPRCVRPTVIPSRFSWSRNMCATRNGCSKCNASRRRITTRSAAMTDLCTE
jgi:hypothetical protein